MQPDSFDASHAQRRERPFVLETAELTLEIWRQQFEDRWEQYIYQRFGETSSPTDQRRRRLLLDLSERELPVARSEIRRLSPDLAAAYADKTDKTLTRDLNALQKMGVLRHTREGYAPNRELVLAFMPAKAPG